MGAGALILWVTRAFAAAPLDYAGEVARAQAAFASGDAQTAVEAWAAAEALSGGNLDTLLGPVPALVALGRYGEAAQRARAGTDKAPDLSGVWMVRGWATRFRPWMPQLGAVAAERSYARAVALAPDRAASWCGLGYTRMQQGDLRGARQALTTAAERGDTTGCADAGLDLLPARLQVDAGVGAGASQWTDHPWRAGGRGAGVWARAASPGSWSVTVTANRLDIGAESTLPDTGGEPLPGDEPPGDEPPGDEPPDGGGGGQPPPPDSHDLPVEDAAAAESTTADSLTQTELWVAAAGRHRDAQVLLLGGRLWTSGYAEGTTDVLGGRVSAALGLTPWAELAGHRSSDGSTQTQAAAGVRVPVWRGLWIDGGGQWSRVGGELLDETLGGTGISGQLGLGWARPDGRAWVQAVGRLGDERRPVRLDEPAVWNVDDTLTRSLRVSAGGEPLPWMALFLAAEGARLDVHFPPQIDPVAVGLSETSTVWLASGGVQLRPVGARKGER
jgi:hypothetical protein